MDKSFWAAQLTWIFQRAQKFVFKFISTILHRDTFDAIEIIAYFREQFPSAGISSPMGFGISHVAFEEPSFWQPGPGDFVQNSSVMHVEQVVDGDRETFIMWAPDFGPSSSTNGANRTRGCWKKRGIFVN